MTGDGPVDVGLLAVWTTPPTSDGTAHPSGDVLPSPRHEGPAHRRSRVLRFHRLASCLLAGLAVVPVLSMLALVRSSSLMQWNDYWDILPRVTNPDGSFTTSGLFAFQNEHPVAVASIVYWLNARYAGGSNVALGYFVVALAVAQVAVLAWALPRQISSVPLRRALFTVAAASLLLAPRGAHNFMLAMSGTAWLTANLFAVLTIFVLWRRPGLALPGAVLASISYGTGLLTWPMLLMLVILEGKPRRWLIITVVAGVSAIGLYLAGYTPSHLAPGTDRGWFETARRVCVVLGSPLSDSRDPAAWLGLVLLGVAGLALALAWQQGMLAALAPWIALFGYALGGAILIALTRSGLNWEVALASRYVSIGALAWLASLVLLQAVVSMRYLVAIGVVAAAVAVLPAGQDTIEQIRVSTVYSDETAIALRLGAVPKRSDWRFNRDAVPLLPAMDHYPFSDDFGFDCGYLGQQLDLARLAEPATAGRSGPVRGHLTGYNPSPYVRAVRLEGWVVDASDPPLAVVRCVVITDQYGIVVGAAVLDVPPSTEEEEEAPEGAEKFSAVATRLPPNGTYRAVAVTGGDHPFVLLPGPLSTLPSNVE